MKLQIISGVNNIIVVVCAYIIMIIITIVRKRIYIMCYVHETAITHVLSESLTAFPQIKVYSAENDSVLKAYFYANTIYTHIIYVHIHTEVDVLYLCRVARVNRSYLNREKPARELNIYQARINIICVLSSRTGRGGGNRYVALLLLMHVQMGSGFPDTRFFFFF